MTATTSHILYSDSNSLPPILAMTAKTSYILALTAGASFNPCNDSKQPLIFFALTAAASSNPCNDSKNLSYSLL
jgi:hypothetical protein